MVTDEIHGSAELSPCGLYRWRLDRWWADGPRALVCGANPSTATDLLMDPTMHRVLRLTRERWAGFTMVNAEAFISPHPAKMEAWKRDAGYNVVRTIQDRNHDNILQMARDAAIVIVAWGNLIEPTSRLLDVLSNHRGRTLYCWGTNANGSPKHPLSRGKGRIANDMEPEPWLRSVP